MKVALITTYDPFDISNWSGTSYFICRSLQDQDIDLYAVGPLNGPGIAIRVEHKIKNILHSRKSWWERDPRVLNNYARQVENKIRCLNPDIILSLGTVPVAELNCRQPIVIFTDATFSGMLNYYPAFGNVSKQTISYADQAEQHALDKCELAIFSSEWASETAKLYYQVDPSKIRVIPFASNIDEAFSMAEIEGIIDARLNEPCHLLFVGREWFRKGGDIAIAVTEELNNRGIPTILDIVGCTSARNQREYVKFYGLLSKADSKELALLRALFMKARFLFVPSRAECAAVVFAESCAFALPIITSNTGGINTIVKNGLNGRSLSLEASTADYAEAIIGLLADKARYKEMALAAYKLYQQRFNWPTVGKTLTEALRSVL